MNNTTKILQYPLNQLTSINNEPILIKVVYKAKSVKMNRFFIAILCVLVVASNHAISQSTLSQLKEDYFTKRNKFTDSSTKKFSETEQAELNVILDQIKSLDANSFEYHLIHYINGNYNVSLKESLFKAYQLNSTDEQVLKEMLAYYVITDNGPKQIEFVKKLQKYYTSTELAYYQDAMPKNSNAVLLSSSQEDLFGFLFVKLVYEVGSDVQLINLDLLKNDDYRANQTAAAGMSFIDFLGVEQSFVKTLITKATKKVFVSSTVPQNYMNALGDNIFIAGLTYQYGAINQRQILDEFWTNLKSKDISKLVLTKSVEKKLYSNYLPPLLTLYRMKKVNAFEDVTLKNSIQLIAEKVGKKDAVNQILLDYEKIE